MAECLMPSGKTIFSLPASTQSRKTERRRTVTLPVAVCRDSRIKVQHSRSVFKNRMLTEIFEPEKEKSTTRRRKLHSEDSHDSCMSKNTFQITKSRRMTLPGYAAWMGQTRLAHTVLRERGNHLKKLSVESRVILKRILKIRWEHGLDSSATRSGLL